MDLLRLIALDGEDLTVISAHLQDAVLKVGDLKWLKREGRFVLVLNRFVWESFAGVRRRTFERRRTALHFDRVDKARAHRIRQDAPDAVLNLLAISFTEGEAPSGVVTLTFAGGGEITLDVECLESQLADLGPAWETANKPLHALDDD